MRRRSAGQSATIFAICAVAGSCGLRVPDISENQDDVLSTSTMQQAVKQKITCELRRAVETVNKRSVVVRNGKVEMPLPLNWGAQINLLFEVGESSSLNPGISLTEPLPDAVTRFGGIFNPVTTSQSYSFGLGAALSSTATRTDKFSPYYSIKDLMYPPDAGAYCYEQRQGDPNSIHVAPFLTSDLKIEEWLTSAAFFNISGQRSSVLDEPKPRVGSSVPPDTMSIEVKFVIVSSASINPSWKLVRVAGNTGGLPFLSTGRTRTHDLLITIGPNDQKTRDSSLASQIRQSLSSASGRALP